MVHPTELFGLLPDLKYTIIGDSTREVGVGRYRSPSKISF